MRKHFRPGNSIVACPLQLLKTVKRCRKGILESICQLLIAIAWLSTQQNRTIQISSTCQHAKKDKKGYQYVPMINTPHPNKALVFPCPLRQRVGQWQLRPLSYNVHQLLEPTVWVCHVALAWLWFLNLKWVCQAPFGYIWGVNKGCWISCPEHAANVCNSQASKLLQLAELEICEFHSGFCTIEEVWENPLLNIPSLGNAKTPLVLRNLSVQSFDFWTISNKHSRDSQQCRRFEIRDWKPFFLSPSSDGFVEHRGKCHASLLLSVLRTSNMPETFGDWCLTRVEISHVCRIWIDVDCHVVKELWVPPPDC